MTSTDTKTWLVTGTGRGMGVDFAHAAPAAETIPAWQAMSGRQAGDPAKLARALVELADSDEPRLRWVAGEDAVEGVEQKARLLLAQVEAHRELSSSLAHDDARVAA